MATPFSSRSALVAVAVALAALVSACGGSSSPTSSAGSPPAAVKASGALLAAATTPLGSILVDGKGRTIYMFAADSGGKSACTGSCLTYWPPVPAPATLPSALTGVTAPIASITRDDGTKQLTVDGRPVYTYVGDKDPGATSGQGLNLSGGLWWVLSPSGAVIKATAGSASPSATTSSGMGYGAGY